MLKLKLYLAGKARDLGLDRSMVMLDMDMMIEFVHILLYWHLLEADCVRKDFCGIISR